MPAGVVYQTIDPAVVRNCLIDEFLDLISFRNITFNEPCTSFSKRVQLGRESITLVLVASTKYDARTSVDKYAGTPLANAFCSAGDNNNPVLIIHLNRRIQKFLSFS